MTKRKIQYWVIPPEANAEFVASMEEVLETYALPRDSRRPVVCMDEQPVQLLKETRVPIPATKTCPRRVDYEYERAGTASIFMFCEPLSGWREVRVREQRTKLDWAREVARLWRHAIPAPTKWCWFATISTRTRRARSMKPSSPNRRVLTCDG
jgi:hypothetical protein